MHWRVFVMANKTSHFVVSWYRPDVDRPDINYGDLPVLDNGNDLLNSLEKFDQFREQLDKIKILTKATPPPLVHVLLHFKFRDFMQTVA